MIAQGNPEVIGDKVGKLKRNDVMLMVEQLAPTSSTYLTAHDHGVLLVQIRNGNPVEEVRRHLVSLRVPKVRESYIEPSEVEKTILAMPLEFFV